MLTADMIRIIDEQRLGFVASVDEDGTPNLSPKGTFAVIDTKRIGFCDIRSPGTRRNIAARSTVEVNFVDPFVRKGYRFKGTARIVLQDDASFKDLRPKFARYGDLVDKARCIVVIEVSRALPLITPAYDRGSSEAELRRQWTRHFRKLQPNQRYEV